MSNRITPSASNLPLHEDFDERFQRAFGLLAFACNRFIMNHMRRISVELEMDLESALIWGTLAHMNVLPTIPMNANPMTVLDELGLKKDPELIPLKLSELTLITGLPRETVRRKLEKLRQKGKVERTTDGRWVYVQQGIGEFERQFTRESILNMLATANSVYGLLDAVQLNEPSAKT